VGAQVLVKEQIDVGGAFVRDFNAYVPVSVACWVFPAETENSFLYLASDAIDGHNIDVAYGEVLRLLGGQRTPWLSPFQVKLVNSSDPVARDAMKFRDRYPVAVGLPYGGSTIGGIEVDGAYVYPSVVAKNSHP